MTDITRHMPRSEAVSFFGVDPTPENLQHLSGHGFYAYFNGKVGTYAAPLLRVAEALVVCSEAGCYRFAGSSLEQARLILQENQEQVAALAQKSPRRSPRRRTKEATGTQPGQPAQVTQAILQLLGRVTMEPGIRRSIQEGLINAPPPESFELAALADWLKQVRRLKDDPAVRRNIAAELAQVIAQSQRPKSP